MCSGSEWVNVSIFAIACGTMVSVAWAMAWAYARAERR